MGTTLLVHFCSPLFSITSRGLAQNVPPRPEFISLESARPVIAGLGSSLPPELAAGKIDSLPPELAAGKIDDVSEGSGPSSAKARPCRVIITSGCDLPHTRPLAATL
ncbi:MAG: hypothetical protein HYR57_03475 [Candidatus Koribacter versatilis]|nr:hypothetical protein [Candidatus Koribacter versatilis]